jgi:hypothetical protein
MEENIELFLAWSCRLAMNRFSMALARTSELQHYLRLPQFGEVRLLFPQD